MGAPKQKWTSEEEAALKAGIKKYGLGKWSTILKDPEFNIVLRSRSNVDLKDKWRNLNCMAHGLGSRHRARVSIKNTHVTPKQDEDTAGGVVVEKDIEVDGNSVAAPGQISQGMGSEKQTSWWHDVVQLEDRILEAITKLKEPRGSSRPTIAHYIEEHYSAPPDFEKTLAANLKTLTGNGRLVKVKNQYRIAPKSMLSAAREDPTLLLANGATKDPSELMRINRMLLTKAKIDAELELMKSMTKEEVAEAAARAVAEAEAAIAEAEAAAREAEEAEAEAEAAKCFHDAAQKAVTCQSIRV